MGGAADVLHLKLLGSITAVGESVGGVHGEAAHQTGDLHRVWRGRRERIQFIVDNDDGFKGVDLDKIWRHTGVTPSEE